MNIKAALVLIDTILNQHLNNLQELIFRQAWEGKSYIAASICMGETAAHK